MTHHALALLPLLAPSLSAQCDHQQLTASDGANGDLFGASVAVEDGTLAVGAPAGSSAPGEVYVYGVGASGWAGETMVAPANGGSPGNGFGAAVSLSADTLAVGSPGDMAGRGSLFLFERSGSLWNEVIRLTASDGAPLDVFGRTAALQGDTVVVGAPFDDDEGDKSGAVYVFEKLPLGGWTETQKLTASDAGPTAWFGEGLAFDGNRIVVAGRGRAYVFEEVQGAWVETARLIVAGAHIDAVAIAGDVLLAGAPGFCFDFACDPDDAFIFEHDGTAWVQTATLASSADDYEQGFGIAVALGDDRAVVGTRGGLYKEDYWTGAAYVFDRASGWAQTTKLTAPEQHFDDDFGTAVAIDGDRVVVGARLDDSTGSRHGAAYPFQVLRNTSSYCFGTDCPCSNDHPAAGCANSTGLQFKYLKGGHLAACGSTSAGADDLALRAANIPANQFGLFYMGAAMAHAPFGDGLRCVDAGGGEFYRFPIANAGPSGVIELGPGIVAYSHATFPASGHIAAGQTWYFQGWFRDPAGFCGSGFNLTNALAVTIEP